MSFFSFIKDVGEKILGLASAAEINAADLKKDLDALGLDTKDLTVELDGDNVVLKGTAKDQETLEKAVLEVGNKLGIAGVKTDGVKVAAAGEESRFCQIPSDKSEGLPVSII
ncbi:BON domain-containing protein [Succinivibrio dextrinosolvens]|uniref:BON domain-containing protein n=1 Tax=Succinivibrio dextrinosolvens TaxID=83771 RepID=UPI000691F820|nr:BON domain-containing protein [Succinivibrio dextrinosolvens]